MRLLDAASQLRPNIRQGWPSRMADTNTIRVFLIDDHPVLRESLARALNAESGMTVVGQAGTAAEALRDIPLDRPDVVLVDLNIPDRDGIELLMVLHAQHPVLRLLVLSGYDDEYRVAEALRAGAQGYLVKTSEIAEVVDGIRRIARGEAPLSKRIAGAVVRAMRKPIAEGLGGLDSLTPREKQVLCLLAAGQSTREAAAQLTISPKTVETHRVRIYQKLGCKSAVELTRIAVRTGLIEA
jgi:DNA-binding NarL/FixJ family response regulator